MKINCLSNVSDLLKEAVSMRLGIPEGTFVSKNILIQLTEQYCIENNIDTQDHVKFTDQIADYIASYLDVNFEQKALATNLENGLNVSEEEFDNFYEQNLMLLNEVIDATPDNIDFADQALQIHKFSKIIWLDSGKQIYISFPEATFGDIHVSPNKLSLNDKKAGYTQEMQDIKSKFNDKNNSIYYEQDSKPLSNTVDKELQQLKPSKIKISEMFDKSKNVNKVLNLLRERGQYNAILDLIDNSKSGFNERLSDVEIQFDNVNQRSNKTLYDSYQGRRAYYDSTNKVVHIDINAPYVKGDASSVIMHEIMHAVTLDLLKSNPEQAAKLREIMDEYSKKVDSSRYSSEHGLEEFVADIWSNEKVIELLKSIKSNEGKASLWDKILNFFNDLFSGRLFGNIENDSLMAQASQELMKLLDMNASERLLGYYFEGENQTDASTISDKTIDDYVAEFEDLIDRLGKKVRYSKNFEEDHKYYVTNEDGEEVEAVSVTTKAAELVGEKPYGKSGSESPALSIGNSFDNLVRDYFNNDIKVAYLNIPASVLDKLKSQLQKFLQALNNEFPDGYRVVTKEFPIAALVNGQYIAGTMDMVVIDNNGGLHIFDMKTFSLDNIESSIEKYTYQLSLYNEILRSNLEGADLEVSNDLGLLTAKITYPFGIKSYESKDGVVTRISTGERISSIDGFDITIDTSKGSRISRMIRGLEAKEFTEEFNGLTKIEKQEYKELPDGQRKPVKQSSEEPKQESLLDNDPAVTFSDLTPVPSTDIAIIANNMVKQIIMYCNMMKTDYYGYLAERLLGNIERDEIGRWKDMPAEIMDVLRKPGAYKQMFQVLIMNNFPSFESEYDIWLQQNVDYLIAQSFGEFKKLTGSHLDSQGAIVVDSQEDIDSAALYDIVRDELEMGIENYDIDKRTLRIKEMMPKELKVKLFLIPKYKYDSNGNIIYKEDGYPDMFTDQTGLPQFVDEDDVVKTLVQNIHALRSRSDMISRMEQLQPDIPWLKEVLDFLNPKSEKYDRAAANAFFKTNRKAETLYSKIYTESEWIKEEQPEEESEEESLGKIGKGKSKSKSKNKSNKKEMKKYIFYLTNEKNKSDSVIEGALKRIIDQYDENLILKKRNGSMLEFNVDEDRLFYFDQLISDINDKFKNYGKERSIKGDIVEALEYLGFYIDDIAQFNKLLRKQRRGYKNNDSNEIYADQVINVLNKLNIFIRHNENNLINLQDKRFREPMVSLSKMISPAFASQAEKSIRDQGKTFVTFTESSPIQDLVDELNGEIMASVEDIEDYKLGQNDGIFGDSNHRFNRFRQFRRINNEGLVVYVSSLLNKLAKNPNLRGSLKHIVHTSTDDVAYFDQNDDQYVISLLIGYSAPDSNPALNESGEDMMLARVPVISDKNSQEWILMPKESALRGFDDKSIDEFKDDIVNSALEFFFFEVQRMMSVLNHLRHGDPANDIKGFHLKRGDAESLMYGKITRDMLVDEKTGKLKKFVLNSGLSFRFMPMLNDEIARGTEFGNQIIDLLNLNENGTEDKFNEKLASLDFRSVFKAGMDKNFEVFYKSLSKQVLDSWSYSVGVTSDEIKPKLMEYFYNDFMATANTMNLVFADPAFFKDTIDVQKRFAQYHSQTQKVDTEITVLDENGLEIIGLDGEPKRFSDGQFRFITIESLIDKQSPLKDVTKNIFAELAKNEKNPSKAEEYRILSETIPGFFEKVDVTDGQGMHTITGLYKKLNMLGMDSTDLDNFFKAVKHIGEGDFSLRNFQIVLQSLKPVATGFVEQFDETNLASEEGKIVVPTYIKDSESLIFLAGAVLHGANKNNVLAEIYQFVEDSHYGFNGEEHNFQTYRDCGIDTIVFDSAVKNGVSKVIDLNGYTEKGLVYNALKSACVDANNNYTEYVKSMPYSGWGIQQNVPDHMQDHEQDIGSQMKVLGVTDLDEADFTNGITVNASGPLGMVVNSVGTKYTSKQKFLKDYFNLVDKEFKIGLTELRELFGIDMSGGVMAITDRGKFNETISKLATQHVMQDQKYSMELLNAVAFLDANKEFFTPIGDPQIADVIFGTIFSQIKNHVNKQLVAGGPVVQMSAFGLSDSLNIVDGNGRRYSDEKFNPLTGLTYECYITAPTSEIEYKITYNNKRKYKKLSGKYNDGDILSMEDIMANNLLSDEELRFIAYRIPTEDKYSIFRMKIKGFLSRRAGEVIIMPKEITALSGTDFDIDKMYCWFKAYSTPKQGQLSDRDRIHNDMFEMQWTSLGLKSSVIHQLNPGNYELLGLIAEEVSVDNDNDDSLLYAHNQAKIKKDNQAGKNYVGIAALNNTCHGLGNISDVRFRAESMFDFNIDGVTLKDVVVKNENGEPLYFQVDPTYSAFDGSRISKTLSMFVGASADNAKYGYLGKLNTSPTTATMVMGLIRMGFPIRTICYIMKSPVVDRMIKDAEATDTRFEQVIRDRYGEINKKDGLDNYKIEGHGPKDKYGNDQEPGNLYKYIHGLLGKSEQTALSNAIVNFLYNAIDYCQDISNVNQLLSLNSTKNAVGPTIYETLGKYYKLKQLKSRVERNDTRFDSDMMDRISQNIPYVMTLESCFSDYIPAICGQISPVCGKEFMDIIDALAEFDTQGNIATEDNIKKLMNGYMIYRGSKLGSFKTDSESRRRLLFDFPVEFMSKQNRYLGNIFLSTLDVSGQMNKKYSIPNIKLDMSDLDKDAVDLLLASWSLVVSTKGEFENEMKDTSEDLIRYFVMRFGFTWQPNSALNVAPNIAKKKYSVITKIDDEEKISTLSDVFSADTTTGWNIFDIRRLIDQFARNNPYSGLWHKVDTKLSDGKYYIPYSQYNRNKFGYREKDNLFIIDQSTMVGLEPMTIQLKSGEVQAPYVAVVKVGKLGIDKNFVEYDAYDNNIETVVTHLNINESSSKFRKLYTELTSLEYKMDENASDSYEDGSEDEYSENGHPEKKAYQPTKSDIPMDNGSEQDQEKVSEDVVNQIKTLQQEQHGTQLGAELGNMIDNIGQGKENRGSIADWIQEIIDMPENYDGLSETILQQLNNILKEIKKPC